MSIPELVKSVFDRGAVLVAEGSKLKLRGVSKLDPQTVAEVSRHRRELILYLREQPTAPEWLAWLEKWQPKGPAQ